MAMDPLYLPGREEIFNRMRRDPIFIDDYQGALGYEILTAEFIQALANHLGQRLADIPQGNQGTIKILEVGAGNGRLSHFLGAELNKKFPGKFEIVATSYPDEKYKFRLIFPSEQKDYRDALRKHKPAVVLCSWMPMDDDWSADFRNTSSVQEYILIGPTSGACGKKWETFGGVSSSSQVGKIPPFAQEGFEYKPLAEVAKTQIQLPGREYDTTTVSFIRK